MNTGKPLVSVIMNCHNSGAYLKEAMDSVYAQTMTDWEIVFFDNVSTDQSPVIAQSYDDRVQYFRSNELLPLGAARNEALALARGQYICFLDCDDVWLPTKLEKQLKSFHCHDSARPIGLCYTGALRIASDGRPLASYTRERKVFTGAIYPHLIRNCFISCSSVMITRAALNLAGGFDTRWHQVEDLDLWQRITKHFDAAYVDEELTKIRLHASNQSGNIFAHFSEKLLLLEQIRVKDPAYSRLCDQTWRELKLQKEIAAFLLARDVSLLQRINLFAVVVGHSLLYPVALFKTIVRYFNRDMVSLFKYKFLKRPH